MKGNFKRCFDPCIDCLVVSACFDICPEVDKLITEATRLEKEEMKNFMKNTGWGKRNE